MSGSEWLSHDVVKVFGDSGLKAFCIIFNIDRMDEFPLNLETLFFIRMINTQTNTRLTDLDLRFENVAVDADWVGLPAGRDGLFSGKCRNFDRFRFGGM